MGRKRGEQDTGQHAPMTTLAEVVADLQRILPGLLHGAVYECLGKADFVRAGHRDPLQATEGVYPS